MAQGGVGKAGEKRGAVASEPVERSGANDVDAGVERSKPPASNRVLDRAASESQPEKLVTADRPALFRSEVGQPELPFNRGWGAQGTSCVFETPHAPLKARDSPRRPRGAGLGAW